jgi:REP element-mobilizing transposase RayT
MRADTVLRHFAPYDRTVPLPLRDESPGYHHVVTRGNNKRDIFEARADYEWFCTFALNIARRHDWAFLGYALMRNHYHFVLRVGEAGLAAGMCRLNSGYAAAFNTFHGRINHLFGRRYWNRRIESDAELMNVVRYVVQNPARAGSELPLDAYPWTSYAGTVARSFPPIPIARDELLPFFGRTPRSAVVAFEQYCRAEADPVESGRATSGVSRRYETRTLAVR